MMDDSNCITLVKKLCESFLIPSERKHVSVNSLKELTNKFLSQLFTYRSDNVNRSEPDDPYSLIKFEIRSRLLTKKCNRSEGYIKRIKRYLQYLSEIHESYDEKDDINSLFLLLYKLSDSGCSKKIFCNNLNIFQQEIGSYKLYSNIDFNRLNWDKFYKDPFSVKSNFNYPFYENPGTDIKFINDYCPDFEPLSNDFTKIFDGRCKLWRFDSNQVVDPIAQDEGFVTPGSEFSSEEEIIVHSSDSSTCSSLENFANNAQCLKPGKRTWEQLGKQQSCIEVPFASEHLESVLHLWKIWNSSQNKTKTFPLHSPITFEELKNDIQYLLFGIDSHSFYFNCMNKTFYIRDKLHVKTLTPEIVSDVCEPLMQCASYYRCIKTFVERRSNLPFGPVHQIFCRSINEILNMYRYSLLNINWENIHFVTQFDGLITSLKRKLLFLVKFCFININEEVDGSSFPSGVQLLDYLYDNLSKMFRSDFGYILFHIFESCCNVYLKVVSEWMFSGCFTNPENYEEFFIDIQREDEICRDWKRVSCIKVKEKRVPKFLEKFYKEIFLCGKSVNLLKNFTTREVLDTILQNTYPKIKCCFNKTQLDEYLLTWQQFQINSDQHFNSKERIKYKLVKSFSVEFYEEINKVRADWFSRYQNIKKTIQHDVVVTTNTSFHANEVIIKSDEAEEVTNEIITLEKSGELNENLIATEDSDETSNSDTVKDTETKTNTKKLVEFYEKLNNSQSNNTTLGITLVTSGESVIYDENKNSSYHKTINNKKISMTSDTISIDCNSPTESHKDEGKLSVAPLDVSIQFGDYKCHIDKPTKSAVVNAAADIAKVASVVSTNSTYDHNGAGDCVILKVNKPTAATVSKPEKLLQTPGASGDSSHATTKQEAVKIINEATTTTELSEYEKNRYKSTYSDHQNLLKCGIHPDNTKDAKETPLSDCARNRLKIMSSNHQNQLNESNIEMEKKVHINTPLCARDQNKLNVMSSEYHQRLTDTNEYIKMSDSIENQKSRELTECERNKLKVMSSEYHVRLLELVEQDEKIEDKLTYRNVVKLNQRELNKQKVMCSEYHNRLTVLSNKEKLNENTSVTEPKCPGEEKSKQELGEENDTKNEEIKLVGKWSETSDCTGSKDSITVLENPLCNNFIKEHDKIEDLNEIPSQQRQNLFQLENYVSYRQTVFPPLKYETVDTLKAKADLVRGINRTSLFYYLSQSVLIPLQIQSKIVNEAVLRVFIEEEGYLDHLMVLRNYFLLRKPEFSLLLTNTIFEMAEKVNKPYFLLNNYTLSCILQQALLAGSSKVLLSFERKLSFIIEDTIPEAFNLIDIKALYCLSLNYSVKWPINVLITETITKKYSRIFKFLMQIQRALWALKSDFKIMKNLKRGKSIQYTQIQLYRHNMTQVIRILQEFIMREALERCWHDLVDYLTSSEISLDDLYISHLKYVNKIMQRCFLCETSQSCHDSVLNLLSSVLKYHSSLRAGTWQRNIQVNFLYHTNFKKIHAVFQEFQKYLNDVRSKLNLLVYTRQRLYFEPLLLELSKRTMIESEL